MKNWTFCLAAATLLLFGACKNDTKPSDTASAAGQEIITAEQLEAEKKSAVRIDSMAQGIKTLGEQIQKSSDDLDKAIGDLPE